jgi:uncharacterized repeat protein (TIGR04042 family)
MHFVVRWPEGDELRCYSPSLVVREYVDVGRSYPLADFLDRSRAMFHVASERVKAKFGFYCSAAIDQLHEIEERAARSDPSSFVTVVAFEVPDER